MLLASAMHFNTHNYTDSRASIIMIKSNGESLQRAWMIFLFLPDSGPFLPDSKADKMKEYQKGVFNNLTKKNWKLSRYPCILCKLGDKTAIQVNLLIIP